ncbi:hypothetical protein HMPREF3191_01120 [Veillonellaceae bacterium DNF00626]|nr:hypothetical protein HMPREF3191_01120 [Veillonellaceae bacterium DNF00626]
MKTLLKALTFSAHGEGGNSEGIDGRGKPGVQRAFSHARCNNLLYPLARLKWLKP